MREYVNITLCGLLAASVIFGPISCVVNTSRRQIQQLEHMPPLKVADLGKLQPDQAVLLEGEISQNNPVSVPANGLVTGCQYIYANSEDGWELENDVVPPQVNLTLEGIQDVALQDMEPCPQGPAMASLTSGNQRWDGLPATAPVTVIGAVVSVNPLLIDVDRAYAGGKNAFISHEKGNVGIFRVIAGVLLLIGLPIFGVLLLSARKKNQQRQRQAAQAFSKT